jgi:hypothetical protein
VNIVRTIYSKRIVRTKMNEQDLRDCFAMFAMFREHDPTRCYEIADAMLEARKPKEKSGIIAVKRSPTTRRSK